MVGPELQHQRPRLVVREEQRLAADQGVHADLGEQPGEHRSDRPGRGRVAVGQPGEQREQRRLDPEDDDQQDGERLPQTERQVAPDLDGEVGHVHGAGGGVEPAPSGRQ